MATLKDHRYEPVIRVIKQEGKKLFGRKRFDVSYDANKMLIDLPYMRISCSFSYNEDKIYWEYTGHCFRDVDYMDGISVRTLGQDNSKRYIKDVLAQAYQNFTALQSIRRRYEG